MAYASISGRARTSSRSPQAHAICDRCGFRYNFVDLHWQHDWRGSVIQNLRVLVCSKCIDTPQEQLRAIVLPADPVPIINARVQDFTGAESDYRAASLPTVIDAVTGIPMPSTTLRVTQDNNNRVVEPYGPPPWGSSVGLDINAIMPYDGAAQRATGISIPVLSVVSDGTTNVFVTCSRVHGLQNGAQIAIQGLNTPYACGFYSVNVTTATAFNYSCYGENTAGTLSTESTFILTAIVGIPRGFTTIPQVVGSKLAGQPFIPDLIEVETSDGVFVLEQGFGFIELEAGP